MFKRQSSYYNLSVKIKEYFWLSPVDLCQRILYSLILPISSKHKKVFKDLLGPAFAVIVLIGLLRYGNSKRKSVITVSPIEIVLVYVGIMPILSYFLNKLGQSTLTFVQVFSLIGYALYGHILTLSASLLFYFDNSDAFFFICLIAFAGVSTLRVVMLQSEYIPLPGARLLVCSFFSTLHILFLIFIHFVYMHPSFNYKE